MAANPVEPDLALHQSLPDLLRNLLRNPVQPDQALHPSLPRTLSGTFSGTLLNLTCTKPLTPSPEPSSEQCWTWPGSFSGTLLNLTGPAPKPPTPSPEPSSPEPSPELCWSWPALRQSLREPSPEPCWTWPGSAPKPPQNLVRNLLRNPVEPNLHQSLPHLLRNLLRNSVEPDLAPSPAPCWTWRALHQSLPHLLRNLLLRNLLRNFVEADLLCAKASGNLLRNPIEPDPALHQSLQVTWLCTKASQTFSGTWNLRNLVEPNPAPAPVHTGAILGWRPH